MFQCYSLAVVGYRVATFNDCVAASEELKKVCSKFFVMCSDCSFQQSSLSVLLWVKAECLYVYNVMWEVVFVCSSPPPPQVSVCVCVCFLLFFLCMCGAIVFECGMFNCCYIYIHVRIALVHCIDCCGCFFVLMVTLYTTVSSFVYIYLTGMML